MSASERLKIVRDSLGKSQKDMAAALGVNYRTYQNYENGLSSIGWDALEALVKLGFNANWLLNGEGAMRREEMPDIGMDKIIEGAQEPVRKVLEYMRANPDKQWEINARIQEWAREQMEKKKGLSK